MLLKPFSCSLLRNSFTLIRSRQSLPAFVASNNTNYKNRFISSITNNKMADAKSATDAPKSIYDFTVKDTYGNDVPLEKYKGQVCLIVNIASQCGLTASNYEKITKLQEKYKDKGLNILSFPCNQFANEMPEKDGEEMVCHLKTKNANLGEVFQKVDVNGENAAPLYKFLKEKQGGILGDSIKWNFTKFIVDKNGQPVDRFAPTTSVTSIESKIEKLLEAK